MSLPKVRLPLDTQGSVIFVDEAGSKGTLGKLFVTAGVKTCDPDKLSRGVQEIRDRYSYTKSDELKFGRVTKNSLPILEEVVSMAREAGCSFGIFVLDKRHFDPWDDAPTWKGHLFATERLIRGMVTRKEIATVLVDHISVPSGVSYGTTLVDQINSRFGNKRIISATSLDSRSTAGLQVADIVASAAYHCRRGVEDFGVEDYVLQGSPKSRLARRIAETLDVELFRDGESGCATVKTSHEKSLRDIKNELELKPEEVP